MKNLISGKGLLAASMVIPLTACSPGKHQDEEKPNIIIFIVDDMGWQDTSVPFWKEKTEFNRLYETPAMERLAAEGMLFSQAYASSVCSPTRVSLLTGMNAARHGVTNWTLRSDTSVDGHDEVLDFPEWNVNALQPPGTGIPFSVEANTLPQILRDNGYFTIHCGKAHLGAMDTPGADPLNLGFDINIAGHAAGGLGSFLGTRNFGNQVKGEHTLPWGVPLMESYHGEDIFLTEALTLEAIKALDSARLSGKPFFLHMSHYAVHIPIEKDMRFYQKYRDKGMCETEAAYASMLEGMDKSLGDIMDYLQENNLAENTIILFISDNGGLSAVARGGEPHTHNLPLRSGKGSAYEGGIRVPMLAKWAGVVKPGSQTDALVVVQDFFPTILEMTRLENYNVIQKVDGVSLTPVLKGSDDNFTNRKLVWHYPNNWGPSGPGIGTTSTIRKGDWKLIYWYAYERFELYNLADDIGEQNNLAAQMPDKVSQLAGNLGSFLRNVNAMRPSFISTGDEAVWPDEVKQLTESNH